MAVKIPPDALQPAITWWLFFLIINHCLSFWMDHRAFRGWNSTNKAPGEGTMGHGTSPLVAEIEGQIGYIKDHINAVAENSKMLKKQLNTNAEIEHLIPNFESLESKAGELISNLEKMNSGVKKLTKHAQFYLWGWYLIMPLFLAFSALLLSYFMKFN